MILSRRKLARSMLAASLLVLLAADGANSIMTIEVDNVRNTRGMLRLCLTRDPAHFPNCNGDPKAVAVSVPAAVRDVRLPAVEPGSYALSVMHDENDNRRLDTVLGVPKEGFGFSRNPSIGFGAPAFAQVRFSVEAGDSRQTVRMRYLL
jgi:uncharacterized protein (DUF2141 family)